ncbi:hypothetical protein NDA13_000085 [Ustilago tritici]|nr:hypothetical protein NDA13_000085 [Ustilago tritici]
MADTDTGNLIHDLLSDFIPYPLFRILAGFSNLIYRLLGSSNDPSSWSSTLLPPLVTLCLAYFALLAAYRTARNMLSLAWFGMKWGAIIGGAIALWAWWTENGDAVNSTGVNQGWGNAGLIGQLQGLSPMFNTLYTQLPGLAGGASGASPYNNRRTNTRRRNTRSRTGNNQHSFSLDPTADLPDDLRAGFGAFADMFGRNSRSTTSGTDSGVDFSSLLRTLVTEGQRQGIDALSALRAAGRVQEELRRFQADPTGWFDGVSDRFRTSTPQVGGAGADNTRSNTRARTRAARGGANVADDNSWWANVAAGVEGFFKPDPDAAPQAGARQRRTHT